MDCWIKTPVPKHNQWHTLAKGIADSQILLAPDQDSVLTTKTYKDNVGSVTEDDVYGEHHTSDDSYIVRLCSPPPFSAAQLRLCAS